MRSLRKDRHMARRPRDADDALFTFQLSRATAEKITVVAAMLKSVAGALASLIVLGLLITAVFL
ncbi:hypothetical protein AFE02nite_19690 [Actinotalea fermentans]|uniref:Uncharacterized protein n=2 Tax=Actinotalea fermentans TaxID=43671 RepID=A0A511YYF9_9CELL|nr:hypothetical protein AFE02nite_19690 [Actinotalea fermentans]